VKTILEISFFGRKKNLTIGEGHLKRSIKKKMNRAKAKTKRKIKKTAKKAVGR
jgi:hypothetical protein